MLRWKALETKKRTGPEKPADALGEVSDVKFGCRSFKLPALPVFLADPED
jgi:hypothetical protein